MDLATLIPLVLRTSIILIVFSLGLNASATDVTYVLRRPGLLLRSLVSMNIVVLLVAIALAAAFDLHPAVKIGIVALAVSPVPPLFPRKAQKSGGEPSYAIGLLVAAAVVAIVFIPFTMILLGRVFGFAGHMSVAAVLKLVLITVLAPLAAGMLVRQIAPALAQRMAKPLSVLAMALLIAGVLPVLFNAFPAIVSLIGNGTLAAIIAFTLAAVASGHLLGGPDPEHRTVLALSSASRHPAVAIAIAHENFPEQKLVAAAVLLYLLVSAIVTIPYVNWSRRHRTRAVPAA